TPDQCEGFLKPRSGFPTNTKIHHIDMCFGRCVKLSLSYIFGMPLAVFTTWVNPIAVCARGNPTALHNNRAFIIPCFSKLLFPALIIISHTESIVPQAVSFVRSEEHTSELQSRENLVC